MFNWLKKREKSEYVEIPKTLAVDYKKWDPDAGLGELVVFNGKAINIRRQKLDYPKYILPEDIFRITLYADDGRPDQVRDFPIDKPMRADEMFTLRMEDELGYTHLLIGGFGQVGD